MREEGETREGRHAVETDGDLHKDKVLGLRLCVNHVGKREISQTGRLVWGRVWGSSSPSPSCARRGRTGRR